MKYLAVVSVVVLGGFGGWGQEVWPDTTPVSTTGDGRIATLEEQVRLLAEQVALLRDELQSLRESKSPDPAANSQTGDRLLLAASHVEPEMLPAPVLSARSSPAPPAPTPGQATQTQTFGGASSNAKLLNPDISLIGDFIGTAGHNTVSPSPSLQF